jgi:hypothetical protein
MRKLGTLNQFIRTVNLLVVLFAVAFSIPASAHANMLTQSVSQHQHMQAKDMGAVQIKMDHDNQIMTCGMTHEKSGDGHNGAQCCFGICGDAVASMMYTSFIADVVHEHDALPYLVMASAESTHLIRPPNL